MEQIQIEKNMREAVKKIETIGAEYAKAKGLSYQMQKMREVVLATEMKKHLGTNAHKEMEAKTSVAYIEHLEGTAEAIAQEQKLRAQYERWQAQYEACRSLLSLEKAKAKIT